MDKVIQENVPERTLNTLDKVAIVSSAILFLVFFMISVVGSAQ